MRVFAKKDGKYVGVQPGTTTVYADRSSGGSWEEVELTPRGDGFFDARFVAADVQLCMTPTGALEPRPAGMVGVWESLYATDQPDGSSLLYRLDGDRLVNVLTLEAAS